MDNNNLNTLANASDQVSMMSGSENGTENTVNGVQRPSTVGVSDSTAAAAAAAPKKRPRKEDPNRSSVLSATRSDVKIAEKEAEHTPVDTRKNGGKSRLISIKDIAVKDIQSNTIRELCSQWGKLQWYAHMKSLAAF